jgi:hypothetical protein
MNQSPPLAPINSRPWSLLALVACGVVLSAFWFSRPAQRQHDRDRRHTLEELDLQEKQRAVVETYGRNSRSPDGDKVGQLKERFDQIKARYRRTRGEQATLAGPRPADVASAGGSRSRPR